MIITGIEEDQELAEFKSKLLGSFLFFLQVFFKLRTGRDFFLSNPVGRECHQITIARELVKVFELKVLREWMSLPPGHGKSTFICYFIAWAFAHYPDCRFIYITYSSELAASHTSNIKGIMEMLEYRKMFGVKISSDTSAKDNFQTIQGGTVKAFGSLGSITGQDAGLPNCDRFSGGVFMDDMHKPSEVFSDTIRRSVIDNYNQTIKPRPRGPKVCMIGIGHALHEDDLRNFLVTGQDGYKWEHLKLAAEDKAGNILAPNLTTREMLNAEKNFNEYVFWSQYQQEPQPAGGGIFKTEWIELLEQYPEMLCTFLTVDTAESTKNYADYTVFSFWGFYEIKFKDRKTGEYGLHWIDCVRERIEPADLEDEFLNFYRKCLDFKCSPNFTAIEKKSTGVTLSSILKKARGMDIRNIERTSASGSKTARFIEMQPYIAKRLISLPKYGKHTTVCMDELRKITANNTHQHDDMIDTLYDACKIAFIDKSLVHSVKNPEKEILTDFMNHNNRISKLKDMAWSRAH